MRRHEILIVCVVAALAGAGGGYFAARPDGNKDAARMIESSTYQRVMRTGVLRCGYVIEPPHIMKDPATGAVTGVIADIMNEAGRLLNIKIDWAEEVGWGNTVEAIRSGRVDAICVNYWMNPAEGKFVGYSMPLYYGVMAPFVRFDDHRFDGKVEAINDPSVTISSTDGELSGILAQQAFPKAKVLTMPNMTSTSENLMNVTTGKADVAFLDAMTGVLFERSNPGKIRNLIPERPLRAFPSTIALPMGDVALKTMLDSAFVQLLYGGFVEKALLKHGVPPEGSYRVAMPYQAPVTKGSALSGKAESVKKEATQRDIEENR